jgi:hypothetical protein
LLEERPQIHGVIAGGGGVLRAEDRSIAAQNDTPGFGCCERRLGSFPDQPAFVFGENGQHLEHHSVRFGHIGGAYLHVGIEELGDERQRPGKPIKPSNEKDGLLLPAQVQSRAKFGPVLDGAALHLREGGDDLLVSPGGVGLDRFLLGLKT